MTILVMYSLSAVYTDLRYERITNVQVIIGAMLGAVFRWYSEGVRGIAAGGISMLVTFLLVYGLFRIGVLGGGDVKLLATAAIFFSPKGAILFVGGAFFAAAIAGICKLLSERNLRERMTYLFSYLYDVVRLGQWKLYETMEEPEDERRKHQIHFALPVLVSTLLCVGGQLCVG